MAIHNSVAYDVLPIRTVPSVLFYVVETYFKPVSCHGIEAAGSSPVVPANLLRMWLYQLYRLCSSSCSFRPWFNSICSDEETPEAATPRIGRVKLLKRIKHDDNWTFTAAL